MKTTRVVTTLALASVAAASIALPNFVGVFQTTYKPKAGTPLATAGCKTCHTSGPKLDAYGADMKKALTAAKTKTLTPAILKKLEKLDSDKDGVKNIVEIKKGTLPGDPKSK